MGPKLCFHGSYSHQQKLQMLNQDENLSLTLFSVILFNFFLALQVAFLSPKLLVCFVHQLMNFHSYSLYSFIHLAMEH